MIIIHGTDTLEITSYFLYRCLYVENKPVILTGSSRINSSHNFDGNANIINSIKQALNPECLKYAEGVTINFAGKIHSPAYIHKEHSFALGLLLCPLKHPYFFIYNITFLYKIHFQVEGLESLA